MYMSSIHCTWLSGKGALWFLRWPNLQERFNKSVWGFLLFCGCGLLNLTHRRWFQNISRHLSKYVTRRETNQCMRFTSLARRDKDERRRFRELRPSRKLTDVQFTVIQ